MDCAERGPLEDAACWLECLLHKDGNSRGSEPLSFPFITSVLSNLLSMVLSSMLSRPLGVAL